ncbi:hypothetical protein C2G38_2106104 [Gigaspora rosea]|uniref:Uncharacterized protein n=1 Tax=Gigaspora rosea TaxID=44941 RepID=A0A397UNZ7_9GLOM|nr:hypothetical protein C2G38_2106104 [Gigaspora rosea]
MIFFDICQTLNGTISLRQPTFCFWSIICTIYFFASIHGYFIIITIIIIIEIHLAFINRFYTIKNTISSVQHEILINGMSM